MARACLSAWLLSCGTAVAVLTVLSFVHPSVDSETSQSRGRAWSAAWATHRAAVMSRDEDDPPTAWTRQMEEPPPPEPEGPSQIARDPVGDQFRKFTTE
jgi:hypothetical protein